MFNARATSPTTGAAVTTINDGDTLDGGAGRDSLNITATADNNRSLTGLSVSNIETVNIAGANNLGVLTTATAAPTAGAAQVQVLDIAGARYMGEVQTVDFGGVAVVTTAGSFTIAGQTVTTAVGDTPQSIAGKVKTALESITNSPISSVTQAGSKLTVLFAPTSAATATSGADANPVDTFLNVSGITNIGGGAINGAVTTPFADSDAVTVTINGIDYATAAITTPAGLGRSVVAAPVAPTVSTAQGAATVNQAPASFETTVVTFADYVSGAAATYTVGDRTLSIAAGSASISGADIAKAFQANSPVVPTGGTMSGALTGFTADGTASNATVTFTASTAGNVADLQASGGALVTARTQGAPAVAAVAAATEVSTVTFTDLAIGQSVTVAGRSVTATTGSLTAAQVAALFVSGTSAGDGVVGGTLGGFTIAATSPASAAATFTSTTGNSNVTDVVVAVAGLTSADILAATNSHANATRDAVKVVVDRVLGGAVTAVAGDDAGELKLTSNSVGVALPTITVSQGTTSRSSVDTGDGATVASAVRAQVAAAKQVRSIAVDDGTTTDFAGTETFEVFVNGASQGVIAIAGGATEANVATAIAAAINTALGITSAAIIAGAVPVAVATGATVTVTAPIAGTALPLIGVNLVAGPGEGSLIFGEVTPNTQAVAQVVSAGTATVNAAQFVGAELINLSGTSGSTTVTGVTAGQTIGFTDVTAMANTVAFGSLTSGSIAVNGSAGTLTTTGNALATLALSGTGTTGLSITDGGTVAATGLDPITTLNLSTSGATVLTTTGMSSLATLTQSGAGAVTLLAGTKLASVTTGAGADVIRVSTATAADVVGTTIDETVTAVVDSGAGDNRIFLATTGGGRTIVAGGAGNDTLFVNTLSTGQNSLSGGAGNDVFRIASGSGLVANLQNTTIAGGEGTDTLRVSNTSFTASDYAVLTANVSGVEVLQLAGVVTALDASRVAMTQLDFRGAGAHTVTEVSSAQAVSVARTAAATAVTGFADATGAVVPTGITITSKDYKAATATVPAVFGDDLNVSLAQTALATSVSARGNTLNLSVAALAQSGTTGAATAVTGVDTTATVTGDVVALNAALASVRGSGTNGAGVEDMAGLTVAVSATNLQNMTSVTVSGAGVVTINAGAIIAADAKLATINLSNMTALANQNELGQEVNGATVGGFSNLSKSTVTLNNSIAETVLLGGAQDTVVTGSTIAAADTITGFQVVASAANPLVVDPTRSDVLDLGLAGGTAFSATNAVKIAVTGSTLEAALLQAASAKAADGTTDRENVVFHFGGDTYVYSDVGSNGLSENDVLVRLTGTLDLDLLLTSATIIG